jgi:YVTN family beta-propeller protein
LIRFKPVFGVFGVFVGFGILVLPGQVGLSSAEATPSAVTSAYTVYVSTIASSIVSFDAGSHSLKTFANTSEGARSIRITPDGKTLVAANYSTGYGSTVDIFNLPGGHRRAVVKVGDGVAGVSVSPNSSIAYVVSTQADTVTPIVLSTGKSRTPITVGDYPVATAVSANGKNLYVLNRDSETVSVINLETSKVARTFSAGSEPYAMALTPDGKTLVITDFATNQVSVIDTSGKKATTRIPVQSGANGVIVSADGVHAYISNFYSSTVTEISLSAHVADWSISVPSNPEDFALSPEGFLYVASYGTGTVSEIDPAKRAVINSIDIGMPNFEIAILRHWKIRQIAAPGRSDVSSYVGQAGLASAMPLNFTCRRACGTRTMCRLGSGRPSSLTRDV